MVLFGSMFIFNHEGDVSEEEPGPEFMRLIVQMNSMIVIVFFELPQ